ncbi:MAG: sulfatase-like hydrolase/transferase, partial [Chitinophagaceae bacterium]|nr:sulfatase-like hydrolase/transferase [Chitinophagaceae bacterium]
IQRSRPRFVYTHILAPHFPYFRDRDGKLRPREKPGYEGWETGVNNPYTNYVHYNNGEIRKLVDTILQKTNGKAVILLLGDHGFHLNMPDELLHWKFNNQCAVYLPNGQYDRYYDSVTNINQFRILFNTLFAQRYPMMKDSCIMVNH